MKNLIILLLAAFSLGASAQTKTNSYQTNNTTQSVKDDGKTMRIKINSNKGGKDINYDRSFSVKGMSKNQKDALVKKITDSLGINPPPPPPAHH